MLHPEHQPSFHEKVESWGTDTLKDIKREVSRYHLDRYKSELSAIAIGAGLYLYGSMRTEIGIPILTQHIINFTQNLAYAVETGNRDLGYLILGSVIVLKCTYRIIERL